MKTNHPVQFLGTPARVLMTTLLVLLVVVIVQMSSLEIARVLLSRRLGPPASDRDLTAEQQRTQRIWRARKEFLPDGTLHLVTRTGGPEYRSQYEPDAADAQVQVYDTSDNVLWDGPTGELPYDYLAWAEYVRRDSFDASELHHRVQTVTSDAKTIEFPVATADELLAKWRYSPWHDCFLGYNLQGERLGYLSAAGATHATSQVQPFGSFARFVSWWPPKAYSPTVLWQTERHIYQINFEKQQVEMVFESASSDIDDLRICRWDSYRPEGSAARPGDRQLLHCQTRDGAYHVILRDPNQSVTVRVPDEWRQWLGNYYQFAVKEQGLFLRRDWTEYPARPAFAGSKWMTEYLRATKNQWVELYRVSETGALDLVNRYSWTVPSENPDVAYVEVRDPRSYVQPYVTAFSGLAYDLAWTALWPWASTSEWWGQGGQLLYELRPGYRVSSWLITTVLLVLTFLHARARCTSKTTLVFWLLFVALLNLAGFLVYWALNHTAVIRCDACGKRRGLGQIDCIRCGAPPPAPEHGKLDLIFGL